MMGFLKREKTDGETVLERLACTLRDFNKSTLVESPVEASADKNKESVFSYESGCLPARPIFSHHFSRDKDCG